TPPSILSIFFFNATPTTEFYTLSLHDALPIWQDPGTGRAPPRGRHRDRVHAPAAPGFPGRQRHRRINPSGILRELPGCHHERIRSEEHTSELQSRGHLVCRLLLEKKKKSRRII